MQDRCSCLVKSEHSGLFRCSNQYIQRLRDNQGTPTTIRTIIAKELMTSIEEKLTARNSSVGVESTARLRRNPETLKAVSNFCLPHSRFFDIFGAHSFASVLDPFPLSCGSNGQAVGASVFDFSSIVSH